MFKKSIAEGLRLAIRRPGLTAIVFLSHAGIAFLLSIPIYQSLFDATSATGFGPDLVARFDSVLIADVMEEADDTLKSVLVQLLWIIPVVMVWKTALAVGILQALRWGGVGSFWDGLGRFTLGGLLVALLNAAAVGLLAGLAVAVGAIVSVTTGQFPIISVGIAIALFLVFGDFADDFGKIVLVCDRSDAVRSWWKGITYAFRRPGAIAVYVAWGIVALAVTLVVARLHPSWASEIGTVWLLFLGQQLLLLIRSGVTVTWLGAEVTFHESTNFREAPLLAFDPLTESSVSPA